MQVYVYSSRTVGFWPNAGWWALPFVCRAWEDRGILAHVHISRRAGVGCQRCGAATHSRWRLGLAWNEVRSLTLAFPACIIAFQHIHAITGTRVCATRWGLTSQIFIARPFWMRLSPRHREFADASFVCCCNLRPSWSTSTHTRKSIVYCILPIDEGGMPLGTRALCAWAHVGGWVHSAQSVDTKCIMLALVNQ